MVPLGLALAIEERPSGLSCINCEFNIILWVNMLLGERYSPPYPLPQYILNTAKSTCTFHELATKIHSVGVYTF